MSMSVRCDGCGLEYAGARGMGGLFAQPRSLARAPYLRMLAEVKRFHRQARRVLDAASDELTLADFLACGGYSAYFTSHFMVPVVSAVWSAAPDVALRYPARYLFQFLDNHGMLQVTGSPQWRTVVGGSRTYVQRAAKELAAVHLSTPVQAVDRHARGVRVRDRSGELHGFDKVVIATHADQALRLLADPSPLERRTLGAFRYSRNETLLHADTSILPSAAGAQASWNYLLPSCDASSDRVVVSYDMNRLQHLPTSSRSSSPSTPPTASPPRRRRGDDLRAPHLHDRQPAAQQRLPELGDGRTAFAGAYHGWGFHEDGCLSGLRAAQSLGVDW